MVASKRRQFFVDRSVQGMLIGRAISYWCFCLLSIVLLVMCWNAFHDPPHSSRELFYRCWMQTGPALVASVLLLPLVLIDTLRASNRFVGPICRLQHAMRKLADGHDVAKLEFREGDFWHESAEQFNRLAAELHTARQACEADQRQLEKIAG